MNSYPNCQEKSNRRHFSFSGHHKNFVVHKNGKNHGFGKKKLIRAILLYAIVRYTLSRFAVRHCTKGTSGEMMFVTCNCYLGFA